MGGYPGKSGEVSWGGNDGDGVTLLSYEGGEVEEGDDVAHGQPWKHHHVKSSSSASYSFASTLSVLVVHGD